MQQSNGGRGCVFSADGYMTKLPAYPMKGSPLAPVGKTFHRTGHAQNAARTKKILTWLKSKMAIFIEQYGHRFLSVFGACSNSPRLAKTPTTGDEPQANLEAEIYWIGIAPAGDFLYVYPQRGT
jgi:hypothetical protein